MSSIFRKVSAADRNTRATLYCGNLDPQVTESLLYELFTQFAPIRSLNIPKDRVLGSHQGFGFVELRTVQDAEYVAELLKGVRLYGKILRIRQAEASKSGASTPATVGATSAIAAAGYDVGARIFVKNLNPLIDEKYLSDTFSSFGKIIVKPQVARDDEGNSKGHGVITFDDFGSSDRAIETMDGKMLMGNKISISYAYKEGTKNKVRHGDEVERLLAENAKANKIIEPQKGKKQQKKRHKATET